MIFNSRAMWIRERTLIGVSSLKEDNWGTRFLWSDAGKAPTERGLLHSHSKCNDHLGKD